MPSDVVDILNQGAECEDNGFINTLREHVVVDFTIETEFVKEMAIEKSCQFTQYLPKPKGY